MGCSGTTILSIVLMLVCTSSALSQGGPWNNPLMMAQSADGRFFTPPVTFQDSSGVPSAIRWKGDTLICAFQWFRQPIGSSTWDRVAVKFSYDNGAHWTAPTPIIVNGFPSNYQRPFDPTLVASTLDSIRIYFSSGQGTQPIADSAINTYSAISADGIHYTFEPNPRVDHPTRRVIDPAIIWFNGSWHYCAPIGAPQEGAYHYTSSNGITFAQQSNYLSDNTHNWTGNYVLDANSTLRFYGSGPQIWYNMSLNGFSWSGYVNTNVQGGDPTVVKLSSASYLIIFVGPPYQTTIPYEADEEPHAFALRQNYPNPFNPSTKIAFEISRRAFTVLKVFDLFGRDVATLVNNELPAGTHQRQFDGTNLSSGIYHYQLRTGTSIATKKMILML